MLNILFKKNKECYLSFCKRFQEKKVLKDNEAVSSEIVANAHIDNFATKLFTWADKVRSL